MSDMLPPEGTQTPDMPPVPTPPLPVGPASKPNLDVGFAILGFFTPFLASMLTGFLTNLLAMAEVAEWILPVFSGALSLIVLIGIIVAFARGRTTGNNRLRSFGLGGLVAIATGMLFSLLAFGACFVLAGANSGF